MNLKKLKKVFKNGFVKRERVVRGVVGVVRVDVQRDANGEAVVDVVAAVHHHRRIPRIRSFRLSPDGSRQSREDRFRKQLPDQIA